MLRNPLGSTGLEVSRISFGSLFASRLGLGFEESRQAVFRAVELGVNFFDTAPAYADSEEILGKILHETKARVIISTKLGGRPSPFDPRDKTALIRSVETSLKNLHRDVIDVLLIHEPDRPGQYDWWNDSHAVVGPVLEVIDNLKQRGVILSCGLGGTTCAEMAHLIRSNKFDVVLTAFNASLLFREAFHEVLPAARERNMGVMLGSILQQGGLGRRYDDVVRAKPNWLSRPRQQQLLALYDLLDQSGISIVEMALRYAIGVSEASTALIGPKTAAQVEGSLAAAAKGPLPDDVARRLDEIAAMVPFRPFEEPMILPLGNPDAYTGPAGANLGAGVKVGSPTK